MKIVHVTKKYPSALGGDAVVVSNLRKHQHAAGHTSVVVTSNCDEIQDASHIYKFGLKDAPIKLDMITPRRLFSLVILFFRMFFILRKERPQIIHTHSIDMAFFVSFAARFYGIPIVHTFHIVTFYDDNQSLFRRKVELWLAKKAKLRYVTAPNRYDVNKLLAGGLSQARLLFNGIDIAFWKVVPSSKTDKIFTFLAIGRLEHQKGYEYLIRASLLLSHATATKFQVVIVGEGSQQAPLLKLIRHLRLEKSVLLMGRKTSKEIRTLLASADALALTSLYETTPLSLLEAWAAAVPVISTPVGILRSVAANFQAAYIVPPQDEHALMQAMKQYITDASMRVAYAKKGQTEVGKYAWPTIARTAEAIYREAL